MVCQEVLYIFLVHVTSEFNGSPKANFGLCKPKKLNSAGLAVRLNPVAFGRLTVFGVRLLSRVFFVVGISSFVLAF